VLQLIFQHFEANFQTFAAWASILGAIVSIYQAKKAIGAKEEVERIKLSLEERKTFGEILELQKWTSNLIERFKKYSSGASPNWLRGASGADDAYELQGFLVKLIENRDHFEEKKPEIKIEQIKEIFNKQLSILSSSKDRIALKDAGKIIFDHLITINQQIKKHYDEKTLKFPE